jgi:hypothetical protein
VWDTKTGDELLTLEGHKNVVYAIAFNNPFGYVGASSARALASLSALLRLTAGVRGSLARCVQRQDRHGLVRQDGKGVSCVCCCLPRWLCSRLSQRQCDGVCSSGTPKLARSFTRTGGTRRRSCASPLTRWARPSPRAPWTTLRSCGTSKRARRSSPCW